MGESFRADEYPIACRNGVILSGTRYHTGYRDRAFDYGAEL